MQITYYGHACFGVEINGQQLLFDPFISPNPLAKSIDVKSIKADFILVTHGHFDHLADAVAISAQTGAMVISNFEVAEWLQKQGVVSTHGLNPGGKWNFPFGSVRCVAAVHSSSMPDGSYGGNPVGFVVESENSSFYYSGDTALTMDMQLIPMLCKPLNLAIFPIGGNYTMDAHDAVIASNFVACNRVLGVHYDTFEVIKLNKLDATNLFAEKGKELTLLNIGETKTF
ncbi:MAG: metal-dependent hydrolase [Chitinophagales bacterium]